jgi:hypothetical protein
MTDIQAKALSIVGAFTLPVVVHTILILGTEQLIRSTTGLLVQAWGVLQLSSYPASTLLGYYILTRAFKRSGAKMVLAMIYLPLALIGLTFWALMLAWWVYGVSP